MEHKFINAVGYDPTRENEANLNFSVILLAVPKDAIKLVHRKAGSVESRSLMDTVRQQYTMEHKISTINYLTIGCDRKELESILRIQ